MPQPDAAVKEILRVLRPGGRLLFIEHVAAPQKRRLARLAQRVLDPLQQALADGCHLTRDTRSVLEGAGFSRLALEAFQLGGGMSSLIAPHVAGLGQK